MTHKVKSIFATALASVALLVTGTQAHAQMPEQAQQMQVEDATAYSDEKLQKFANATKAVQQLQMDMQQKMAEAVEKEGLDPMEFQKMAQAKQSGSESSESQYSEEKEQAYANAMKAVMEMQPKMQSEMQTELEEHGMTMQEYQAMAMAIQQSPEVATKVRSMIQGS